MFSGNAKLIACFKERRKRDRFALSKKAGAENDEEHAFPSTPPPPPVTTAILIMDKKLSSCRIYIVDRDE
jgi:hypothetical protein